MLIRIFYKHLFSNIEQGLIIDLSKAFVVDHRWRYSSTMVQIVFKWSLSSRPYLSNPYSIKFGVPQGSILGPILLNIFLTIYVVI